MTTDERNQQTSEQEVNEFKNGKHAEHFASYSPHRATITTWMGDTLCTDVIMGKPYRMPAYGRPSTRQNFRAKGIDGRVWWGTYYSSAGDYVRMRPLKASSPRAF